MTSHPLLKNLFLTPSLSLPPFLGLQEEGTSLFLEVWEVGKKGIHNHQQSKAHCWVDVLL